MCKRLCIAVFIIAAATPCAAQGLPSMGTDFWFAFMPNYLNPAENIRLFIASPTDNHVTIEFFGGTDVPQDVRNIDLKAGDAFAISQFQTALAETRKTETVGKRAVHVTSRSPIAISGFSNVLQTSDGFLAIPTQSLDREYYTANYFDDQYFNNPVQLAGEFVVVAPYDNTDVTITARARTRLDSAGPVFGHDSGATWTVRLNHGDTYLVQSTGLAYGYGDLTGSHVVASKPIGVLSGHQRCTIPIGYSGDSKNHLIEMMPPVSRWGKKYYDVPMVNRAVAGNYVRFLAAENNTTVFEDGNVIASINKGEWWDANEITKPAIFTSNKNFLVLEYAYSQGYQGDPGIGDPCMIALPAAEHYQKQMEFRVPENVAGRPDYLNVFVMVAKKTTLDSLTINNSPLKQFSPFRNTFPGDSSMQFARIQLQSSARTYALVAPAPVGAWQYGFTSVDGYGWPASNDFSILGIAKANPIATISLRTDAIEADLTVNRAAPNAGLAAVELVQDSLDVRSTLYSTNVRLAIDTSFVVGDTVYRGLLQMIDTGKAAHATVWSVDQGGNQTVTQYDFSPRGLYVRPPELGHNLPSTGTDFWIAFMPNGVSSADSDSFGNVTRDIRLLISSQTNNHVTVEFFGGDSSAQDVRNLDISAGQSRTLEQYRMVLAETRKTETVSKRGVHVTSRSPIALSGYSRGFSGEGFLAIPTQALDREYFTANYFDDHYLFDATPLSGEFVVVAPYDNTLVTITTRARTRLDTAGNIMGHDSGATWTVRMNKGDTYLVQSTGQAYGYGDLTGSHIVASNPVAVLSGHQSCTIPIGYRGDSKNNILEMMPPVSRWGAKYYDVPMVGRTVVGNYVRLIAAQNNTNVFANGNQIATLNQGEWRDAIEVKEPTVFTANKNFLTVEYSYSQGYKRDTGTWDPLMIVLPSAEHYQKRMIFRTLVGTTGQPDNENLLVLVANSKTLDSVTINNSPLRQFSSTRGVFSADNLTEFARVVLPSASIAYVLESPERVGASQYGFSGLNLYGWPGSNDFSILGIAQANPIATVTLRQDSVTADIKVNRAAAGAGLAAVELVQDSLDIRNFSYSQNVRFDRDTNFIVGDTVYRGSLHMVDSTKPAHAYIWSVDQGGNETLTQYHFKTRPSTNSGIPYISEQQFAVTPNPAHNKLTIDFPETADYTVTLIDMTGKTILTSSYASKTATIDISSIANGEYIVVARSGATTYSNKIVVAH